MKYKVCILAAGVGNRMGELSDNINIAILPVNHKAVISYIVEKFGEDTEFVVAVGHKKETVIDYLKLAHPKCNFKFVEIDRYTGPGTGPGYSILQCKKYLQSPFTFFTADTMVLEEIPLPDQNWMGIAPVRETEAFCTVKLKNNLVCQLDNKIKTDNKFAFIGLGGVKDYIDFFDALKNDQESGTGGVEVTTGFGRLIEKKLVPIGFTWFDTGSLKSYTETNRNFSGGGAKFDFSKGDEFLYFVNDRVVKFFVDVKIAKNRYIRAQKYLKGLCPPLEALRGNFYAYKLVEGQTLYNALNPQLARDFLAWAQKNLWKKVKLNPKQKSEFDQASMRFYKDKTLNRIEMYRTKNENAEERGTINGLSTPSAHDLLQKLDWSAISSGTPVLFHGDLQFDNVLFSGTKKSKRFVLLDWRQDFGGLISAGDLYYDLAKLYGGVTISYPLIKEGMFSFTTSDTEADYAFFIKSDLIEAKEELEKFILQNNYDLRKVKIITALIFLNMAPLHNEPFDGLLYSLGRSMLARLV